MSAVDYAGNTCSVPPRLAAAQSLIKRTLISIGRDMQEPLFLQSAHRGLMPHRRRKIIPPVPLSKKREKSLGQENRLPQHPRRAQYTETALPCSHSSRLPENSVVYKPINSRLYITKHNSAPAEQVNPLSYKDIASFPPMMNTHKVSKSE